MKPQRLEQNRTDTIITVSEKVHQDSRDSIRIVAGTTREKKATPLDVSKLYNEGLSA